MGCTDSSGSQVLGPIVCWTAKSDQEGNAVFVPIGSPRDSSTMRYVRPSITVEGSSGGTKVKAAVRMTHDGLTFDTPVTINGANQSVSGNGTSYGADHTDMQTTLKAKQLVQPGVIVNNNAPSLASRFAS